MQLRILVKSIDNLKGKAFQVYRNIWSGPKEMLLQTQTLKLILNRSAWLNRGMTKDC